MGLTCKEAEKLMNPFIRQELRGEQLKRYCEHVRKCKQCQEDLEIHYLVHECLKPEVELTSFNLHGQLEQKLQDAEHAVRQEQLHQIISVVITVLAGVGLSCVLLMRAMQLLARLL